MRAVLLGLRAMGLTAIVSAIACVGSAVSGADGAAGGGEEAAAGLQPLDAAIDATLDAPANPDAAAVTGTFDAGCVEASVTFQIETASTSTRGFCIADFFPPMYPWVGVRPAGSQDAGLFQIQYPCPAYLACQACSCNGGGGYFPLGEGGATYTWDGTSYLPGAPPCDLCGMCGSCYARSCAAPGRYIAMFCASPTTGPADASTCDRMTNVCTETAFDWPPDGSAVVVGVLGP